VNILRELSSTLVQGAVASAQDATRHGKIQTCLSGLVMVSDSDDESTACLSPDLSGGSSIEEQQKQEEEEDGEEGEKDLTVLRRSMARLKASLEQLRDDPHAERRLHLVSSFATLKHGLEVLERIRNS